MQAPDIILLVFIIVVVILAALFFLSRWLSKKSGEQQGLIEKNKMAASIFAIDKKHERPEKVNLPKAVIEGLPRAYKMMKLYFVKAKVGPQIVTLMCDKKIYNHIKPKNNYKVELAGIYIVSVKGMKTDYELKKIAKDKKEKAKNEKKK